MNRKITDYLNTISASVTVRVPNNQVLRNVTTRERSLYAPSKAWLAVVKAIVDHHHKPDVQAARCVCSAIAAHGLKGAAVWPMPVAPPGSMKTHLLEAYDGLPNVHLIDQMTAQSFISGQLKDPKRPSEAPPSLLHRIGSGILIYPDFSTVLAMKPETKATILADMRRIYDGQIRKEYGTAENLQQREWKGRITFVAGVTPEISRFHSVFQTLGERFIMIRWPRSGGVETAVAAIEQNRDVAKAEMRRAIHELMASLPAIEPTLSREMTSKIGALSELAVIARTHVQRGTYSKEIEDTPQPESATRLPQQLAQLGKGSALIDGRAEVDHADYEVVCRTAFDCMPPIRKQILEAMIANRKTTSVKAPESTRKYAYEDLQALGLIEECSMSTWKLSRQSRELLIGAGFDLQPLTV